MYIIRMRTKVLRNVFSNTANMVSRQFSNKNDTSKIMFTKTHEYIKFDKQNIGTIGISSYAVNKVGDIIFTELIGEDEAVEKNQSIGILESVKSANEIYTPVNGIIVEQNKKVIETPELINEDPMGEGWLVKISCVDKTDPDLMDHETYNEYIKTENSE
jgi:glycine cleavage system H protein